jgi:ribosomal protein L19E
MACAPHNARDCEVCQLRAESHALLAERDALRAKNKELNRRCQAYEAALRKTIDEHKRAGVSFGRMLARGAATMYMHKAEELRALLREVHEGVLTADLARRIAEAIEPERTDSDG